MAATYIETKNLLGLTDHERSAPASLSTVISRWRTNLASWLADRRKYRKTLAELHPLSDHELADIGITRWQIREVARGSIAGNRLGH